MDLNEELLKDIMERQESNWAKRDSKDGKKQVSQEYSAHKKRRNATGAAREQNKRVRGTEKGHKQAAARDKVRRAKEQGEIKQPKTCPKCGTATSDMIFDHDKSYEKSDQLAGRFMCRTCHNRKDNNKPGDKSTKGKRRPGIIGKSKGDTEIAKTKAEAVRKEISPIQEIINIMDDGWDVMNEGWDELGIEDPNLPGDEPQGADCMRFREEFFKEWEEWEGPDAEFEAEEFSEEHHERCKGCQTWLEVEMNQVEKPFMDWLFNRLTDDPEEVKRLKQNVERSRRREAKSQNNKAPAEPPAGWQMDCNAARDIIDQLDQNNPKEWQQMEQHTRTCENCTHYLHQTGPYEGKLGFNPDDLDYD